MRLVSSFLASLAITCTLANPGTGRGRGKGWGHHGNDLTARSRAGSFTGFVDPEVPDVAQWLGVPYGAPPVGDQRFLPPKPAAYAGDIATTSYKPICMQNGGPGPGVFWEVVPEFQNTDPQAEDCLYLNIWGPRKTIGGGIRQRHQKKVPVIIWSKLLSVRCWDFLFRRTDRSSLRRWLPGRWRPCSVSGPGPLGAEDADAHRCHFQVYHKSGLPAGTATDLTPSYRLSVWGYPGARAAPVNAGLADIRLV